MGTLNRMAGTRMLTAAVMMAAMGRLMGAGSIPAAAQAPGVRVDISAVQGFHDNKWRTPTKRGPNTAAAHKRASRRLRNIRARASKR